MADGTMRTYTMLASVEYDDARYFKYYPLGQSFNPAKHTHPFRLLDADGYDLGYGLSEHGSNFDPLDDYQEHWGAVTIEYWDQFNERWEPL